MPHSGACGFQGAYQGRATSQVATFIYVGPTCMLNKSSAKLARSCATILRYKVLDAWTISSTRIVVSVKHCRTCASAHSKCRKIKSGSANEHVRDCMTVWHHHLPYHVPCKKVETFQPRPSHTPEKSQTSILYVPAADNHQSALPQAQQHSVALSALVSPRITKCIASLSGR